MVTKLFVLFFALFFFSQVLYAQAYNDYVIQKGETVSLIALKVTRNAANWRSKGVQVINSKTDRPIAKRRFNRVYPGWIVRIDKQLVKTEGVTANGRTLIAVCTQYAAPYCAETLRKLNSLKRTTVPVEGTIFVPVEFNLQPTGSVPASAPVVPAVNLPKEEPAKAAPETPAFQPVQTPTIAKPLPEAAAPLQVSAPWKWGLVVLLTLMLLAVIAGFITLNPTWRERIRNRIKIPESWLSSTARLTPQVLWKRRNREIKKRMQEFADRFFVAFRARLKDDAIRTQSECLPNSMRINLMIAPVEPGMFATRRVSTYPNLSDHEANLNQDVREIMSQELSSEPFLQEGPFTEKIVGTTTWVVIPFRMTEAP